MATRSSFILPLAIHDGVLLCNLIHDASSLSLTQTPGIASHTPIKSSRVQSLKSPVVTILALTCIFSQFPVAESLHQVPCDQLPTKSSCPSLLISPQEIDTRLSAGSSFTQFTAWPDEEMVGYNAQARPAYNFVHLTAKQTIVHQHTFPRH